MSRLYALAGLHTEIAEGFRFAAGQAGDGVRATKLIIQADARDNFARELSAILSKGDVPGNSGPVADALRRWSNQLLDLADAGRERALILEIERVADAILAHFEDAIEESLQSPMGSDLLQQIQRVNGLRGQIGRSTFR